MTKRIPAAVIEHHNRLAEQRHLSEAQIRLMQAARAMLAALKRAAFYIEVMIDNDAENDIDSVDAKVDLDALRAAIAQAEKAGITTYGRSHETE